MSAVIHQENCNIVAGETLSITSLSIVQNVYRGGARASRTGERISLSKTFRNVAPQTHIALVVEAYQLQELIRNVLEQIKTSCDSSDDYVRLVEILEGEEGGILAKTIPFIFISFGKATRGEPSNWANIEYRLLDGVRKTRSILEEFLDSRKVVPNELYAEMAELEPAHAVICMVWDCLCSATLKLNPFGSPIVRICRKLCAIRDQMHLQLFATFSVDFMGYDLKRRVHLHHINVRDFFGAQWSLPQDICLNKEVFIRVLLSKFKDSPAEKFIALGMWNAFGQDCLQLIENREWGPTIQAGTGMQLSIIIPKRDWRTSSTAKLESLKCPRCGCKGNILHSDNWARCFQCGSTYNIHIPNVAKGLLARWEYNALSEPTAKTL